MPGFQSFFQVFCTILYQSNFVPAVYIGLMYANNNFNSNIAHNILLKIFPSGHVSTPKSECEWVNSLDVYHREKSGAL